MIIDKAERLKTTKEYYFSVKLQEVRGLIAKGKDIINIAIGSPDMAPSQSTRITSYNVCYTKLLRIITNDFLTIIQRISQFQFQQSFLTRSLWCRNKSLDKCYAWEV